MPRYIEVIQATTETATKILALREGSKVHRILHVTTEGGTTASVNWSDRHPGVTLNMPTLPPDAVLNRAEADRLVAFIAHECCHVIHTNRKAWDKAVALGNRVRGWTNALEDVRIEQAEIKAEVFPALRTVLSGMANHLHAKALADHPSVTIGSKVAHADYVTCILGRVANGYAIPAARMLAPAMSPDVAKLVQHALRGIRRCRDTDQVRALAVELVAMERQLAPQPPQQPTQDGENGQGAPGEAQDGQDGQGAPGEAQDGQDGQGAPGEAQDGQDGQGAPGEAQDGQDGQGAPGEAQDGQDSQDAPGEAQDGQDGQGAPGEAQDGQDGQRGGDGQPIPSDASLSDTTAAIAKRAGIADVTQYAQTDRGHALSTAVNAVRDWQTQNYPGLQRDEARKLDQLLPRNSVLHGQIARLLVSEEVHRRTHHETSGRLDRRALVRMRAGALDVYSRKDDTPGVDTALLVLIDGSSSMDNMAGNCSRIALAQAAAWHITKAAEAANAKVCVAGFFTAAGQGARRHHGGMTGTDLRIVKPWSAAVTDCAVQIAALEPDDYTPLSPAILTGARMLAEVNATRHILMVLTDGQCDYGATTVTRACTLASDLGVEVVGVGMDCAEVADAFPPRYSVNVCHLDQLAGAGLGVLVAMLEDANPRGGAD